MTSVRKAGSLFFRLRKTLLSTAIFQLRHRSLLRGNILVLASLALAFRLADFPNNRATLLLVIPALLAILGTADSIRCMRGQWSWYHGGVILCIYMDLMAVCMIVFMLLYPYANWLATN